MKNTRGVDKARLLKKEEALLELLSTHHQVYVHLDSRRRGVLVPKELQGRPQLAFCLGLNLPVPIRDLLIKDDGWSATLSIGRVLHRVYVPWHAVFLIVGDSGIGNHWPKDTPKEARIQREETPPLAAPEKAIREARKTLPPGWKIIEGGASRTAGGFAPPGRSPEPPEDEPAPTG